MHSELLTYINGLDQDAARISKERQEKLVELSEVIRAIRSRNQPARIVFICTHNSRRSHLCQIWAATLADHLSLDGIETYSGGTEVTAFNPRAVEAIRRAGFTVENTEGENPQYKVFYDEGKEPLVCYSKTFDDEANPSQAFVAVLTCSDADRNCPIVPGAEHRITIPYDDPKPADGTPQEAEVYDRRCRQIAAEIYYGFYRLA